MMSLVDYASSSDDDDTENREEQAQENQQQQQPQQQKPPLEQKPKKRDSSPSPIPLNNQGYGSLPHESRSQPLPPPQFEKLPDASILLNSPTIPLVSGAATDHSARVSAAMAESASRRKRDLSGVPSSSSSLPRGKIPRGGTIPHTKNVPDTGGGMLVPPQLSGRKNVVTEDIGKLFVRRQMGPSAS